MSKPAKKEPSADYADSRRFRDGSPGLEAGGWEEEKQSTDDTN
jgi:hypothetical protein